MKHASSPPVSLQIGGFALSSRVVLAPMSGITDAPFRRLAARLGAGLVVSEMTASDDLVRGRAISVLRCESAGIGPHVVQLAGCQAHWMAEGARVAEAAGADIIDINMGCPARHVTGGQSGSALMRDLDHALRLIDAVVGAVAVPVTLKCRLGWDEDCRNAAGLARRAEAAGVRMVTVHGRTRQQFYAGRADWAAIRAVSDAVAIPVVANGDIVDPGTARAALAASGAAGVMVGRGTRGAPWRPAEIAAALSGAAPPKIPSGPALADYISDHYEDMLRFYGNAPGLRVARKHLGWYAEEAGIDPAFRAGLMLAESPGEVLGLIARAFAETGERRAA